MKAIMISIKPKWVTKILNGEKTIEIRKTCPEIFKRLKSYEGCSIDVYIYCSQNELLVKLQSLFGSKEKFFTEPKTRINKDFYKDEMYQGKVVAKFTLNKVDDITYINDYYMFTYYNNIPRKACLTEKEMFKYLNHKTGYAWHISNLEIFDRPKELSEFRLYNNGMPQYEFGLGTAYYRHLTKAPQSWCYVEVE